MSSFNVLTIECHSKAGGSDKAEKIAREIIITETETTNPDLPGFEFYHGMNGDLTVTTNIFQLAILMAKARGEVKRILEAMVRNRQVRDYYINPLFVQ